MTKHEEAVAVHREPSDEAAAGPLASWTPMMSLREEIDRIFDDFGSGFWRHPLARRPSKRASESMAWRLSPLLEVVECDGEYRIAAELPGLSPADVDIRLNNGTLTIRGEKTEEKREEKADYLLSERHYGAFHRSVPLPSGADTEHIKAELTSGVLTITIPKTKAAMASERKIEVKAA